MLLAMEQQAAVAAWQLCRRHGMLRGLAKGARRERGSFSGGIALLARGEVVAVTKPDRELQTLRCGRATAARLGAQLGAARNPMGL